MEIKYCACEDCEPIWTYSGSKECLNCGKRIRKEEEGAKNGNT